MRYHFSISYKGEFQPVSDWLLKRAAAEPLAAIAEGARGYYYIVFADSREFANQQQQEFDAGRGAYCGVGMMEVAPDHGLLRVNLECGDKERDAAAAFIGALFNKFPTYSVYDEDSSEDITDQVRVDASILFSD